MDRSYKQETFFTDTYLFHSTPANLFGIRLCMMKMVRADKMSVKQFINCVLIPTLMSPKS